MPEWILNLIGTALVVFAIGAFLGIVVAILTAPKLIRVTSGLPKTHYFDYNANKIRRIDNGKFETPEDLGSVRY